jgi:hypothetical protein
MNLYHLKHSKRTIQLFMLDRLDYIQMVTYLT